MRGDWEASAEWYAARAIRACASCRGDDREAVTNQLADLLTGRIRLPVRPARRLCEAVLAEDEVEGRLYWWGSTLIPDREVTVVKIPARLSWRESAAVRKAGSVSLTFEPTSHANPSALVDERAWVPTLLVTGHQLLEALYAGPRPRAGDISVRAAVALRDKARGIIEVALKLTDWRDSSGR